MISRLNRASFSQDFFLEEPYAKWLERYKAIPATMHEYLALYHVDNQYAVSYI